MNINIEKVVTINLIVSMILYPCILLPISLKFNILLLQPICVLTQTLIICGIIVYACIKQTKRVIK